MVYCINQIYINIAYLPFTNTCDGRTFPACHPACDDVGTSQNLWPVSRQIPLLACRHARVIPQTKLSLLALYLPVIDKTHIPRAIYFSPTICLTTDHIQSLSN